MAHRRKKHAVSTEPALRPIWAVPKVEVPRIERTWIKEAEPRYSTQRAVNETLACATPGTPRMLGGDDWAEEHHYTCVRAEDHGEWVALEAFEWGGILAGV